jgi:hypothetical protein
MEKFSQNAPMNYDLSKALGEVEESVPEAVKPEGYLTPGLEEYFKNMRAEEIAYRQRLVEEGYREGLEAYRPVAEGVRDSWSATKGGVRQSEEILDYINEATATPEQEANFGEYQGTYDALSQQVAKAGEAYAKLVGAENAPTAEAVSLKFAGDFAAIVENCTAAWLKEQMETEKPLGVHLFENRPLSAEERKSRNARLNPNDHYEWEDRDKYWTDEQLNTVDGTDSPFGIAIVMDDYSIPAATADKQKQQFDELHAKYPSLVIPKDNICLARNQALIDEGKVDLSGSGKNFDLTYTRYVDLPAVDSHVPRSCVCDGGGALLDGSRVGRELPVRLAVVRQP